MPIPWTQEEIRERICFSVFSMKRPEAVRVKESPFIVISSSSQSLSLFKRETLMPHVNMGFKKYLTLILWT
jgi:hypothetical protein